MLDLKIVCVFISLVLLVMLLCFLETEYIVGIELRGAEGRLYLSSCCDFCLGFCRLLLLMGSFLVLLSM